MRTTIADLQKMRDQDRRIPMITAYDYTSALIVERAGIPIILVGDSVGQVVLGHDSTIPVTMDDMIRHIQMVVRGTDKAHIVGDMPFMSYQSSCEEALKNAGRLLKEGGCQSVKLEGGKEVEDIVRLMVKAGIPVMGHLGFTPQSVNQLGGYRVQGRTTSQAQILIDDALALQNAGVYAVVLELVPADLSDKITKELTVPTIGIGAGLHCSGQVQVFHDILGLFPDFTPKHSRRYVELGKEIENAVNQYTSDVISGSFPSKAESF